MKRQRRNEILVKQVVDRLKTVRRERGLTQENVRFDTDLNIGRIESGRHSISLTTLADLCDYYSGGFLQEDSDALNSEMKEPGEWSLGFCFLCRSVFRFVFRKPAVRRSGRRLSRNR